MAAVQAHEFELDLSAVRARNTVFSRTYGRQVLLTKAAKDREGPASARRSSPPTRPPNRGVQTARAPARGSSIESILLQRQQQPDEAPPQATPATFVDSLEVALRAMEAQSVQRRIVASPSRPVMALDGRRNKAPAERSREAWFQKQEYYLRKRRVAESDRATYLTTPSLAIKPISIEILRTLQSNDDALQLQGRLYAQKLDGLRRKLQSTAQTIDALRRRGAPLSDVDACREAIEAMESAIAVFRSNQHAQFDDLVVHEGQLERDLHRFETKMDAWSNERPIDRPTTGKAPRVAAANDVETRQDIERVRMLDSLLHETGDACGGWAYDDHAHFVAVLHASGLTDPDDLVSYFTASTVRSDDDGHNNHDDDDDGHNDDDDAVANEIALLDQRASVAAKLGLFRTKCHAKLPFKTTSAVQTHLEWYAQHLSLQQAKKKTIANWRERKKSLERRQATASSQTNERPLARSSRNVTERQRKKSQILEWKAAKAQQSQRAEPEMLTAQASVATLKRIEIKQKIALYKLEKEEEQMRQANLSELMKPMARAPSKEQLMTSAERAVHAAKARLEKVLASAAATRQAAELPLRPKSSRQLLASASSDLLKPTAASAARAVTPDEVEQQSAARAARAAHRGYIPGADGATHVKGRSFGHVPSQPRATPEWRKRI